MYASVGMMIGFGFGALAILVNADLALWVCVGGFCAAFGAFS